jgi:hypothetical protein
VWEEQSKIGLANMVIGWISKAWAAGLAHYGSKDPEGQAAQLLTLAWDGLCEPVWEMRNSIFNDLPNPAQLQEMQSLEEKLQWYHRHRFKVLAHRHRFLAEYRIEDLGRWDRNRRKETLRGLERARRIYEIECTQRVQGQQVLSRWLDPDSTSVD